jgi:hypothetical protein
MKINIKKGNKPKLNKLPYASALIKKSNFYALKSKNITNNYINNT